MEVQSWGSLNPGCPFATGNHTEEPATEDRMGAPRACDEEPGLGAPKLLDIYTLLGQRELETELGPWAEEPWDAERETPA